jgi:SAM-dependent methyltransferase
VSEIPSFLRPDVAAAFQDQAVARSYRHRPEYPAETFQILTGLIRDDPRSLLDLGCGTGFLARPLAQLVDQVDAVDPSVAMIEEGKRLPGGNRPQLRWMVGHAEDVKIYPPYALVTAGDSLHWMEWGRLLPRLSDALSPGASLAILSVGGNLTGGADGIKEEQLNLIRRYTTYGEWRPEFDLVSTLEQRGLFRTEGRAETGSVPFRQPVNEYVESFHARASLSWQRMDRADAAAFDRALRQLLLARVGHTVHMAVHASITWGRPLRP